MLTNLHLIDQLHFMLEQETTHYQMNENYLTISLRSTIVTSTNQRSMYSWSYDIIDACSIDCEIVCIGMSYFDCFMCTTATTNTTTTTTTACNITSSLSSSSSSLLKLARGATSVGACSHPIGPPALPKLQAARARVLVPT